MSLRRLAVALLFVFSASASTLFAGYRMSSWIVAHDTDSLVSTQVNASRLTESNPVWYQIQSDGAIARISNAENPTWRAAMTGTEIIPTIQNIVNGSFDKAIAVSVISTAEKREIHAEHIRNLVRTQGFDGIDIDYERMPSTSKADFSAFITLLASKLHADGKKLSVCVYGQTTGSESWDGPGGQDYAALGAAADSIKIMLYPYHYSGTEAGALSPIQWIDSVLAFAKSRMAPSKVIAGLPWYGKDWLGTSASSLSYAEAMAIATTNVASITHDIDGEAVFSYGNHTVVFNDAVSYDRKLNMIVARHPTIGGIAHWANGQEDPAVWARVEAMKNGATVSDPDPDPPALPTVPVVNGPSMVVSGGVWRYLDNGVDQGTSWRTAAFDDASWKSGASQLGYGEGDERTIVGYGVDRTAKNMTAYFRYPFDLADPSQYGSLTLNVLRDDGAVVYINGVEVVRTNMPTGTIGYSTPAAGTTSDEATFFSFTVSPSVLVSGRNVIAVEVHQSDATSSDLSFDFAMTGVAAPAVLRAPGALVATASQNRVDLTWTDNSADETAFVVERCAGVACGNFASIGQLAANVTSYGDASLAAATSYSYRLRAVRGTESAVSNVATATTPAAPVVVGPQMLVARRSTWRYLDNGSNQGTIWNGLPFVDSTWKTGVAEFGYGEGDEATIIAYGSKKNRYVTTYFRRTFNVSSVSGIQSLLVRLKRDDGAVVYLNGVEIWRSNMPTGAIGYRTLAPSTMNGADETTFFEQAVAPSLLRAGTNVIAVEVHQSDTDSSDVSFDLELVAQ
jgi:spore germination protein YaaH